MTLLFSMLLFNAADEITDLEPIDVSQGIKDSALIVLRVIVESVRSGELVSFENNSLFQAALREFIRNLSRMADDLLPYAFGMIVRVFFHITTCFLILL